MHMITIVFGLLAMHKEQIMKDIQRAGFISKLEASSIERLPFPFIEYIFYMHWYKSY